MAMSFGRVKPSKKNPKQQEKTEQQATPKKKKNRVKEVVVIVFAIFIAISMMLPSISAVIMGITNQAQQNQPLTPERLNAQMLDSVAQLEQDIDADPNNAELQLSLGSAYMQWASTLRLIAQQDADRSQVDSLFQKGIAAYAKAVEIDPSAQNVSAKAIAVFMSGDEEGAIQEIKDFLKEHKDDPYATSRLALMYEYQGRLDEALKLYEEALANDPEDSTSIKAFVDSHIQSINDQKKQQEEEEKQKQEEAAKEAEQSKSESASSESSENK